MTTTTELLPGVSRNDEPCWVLTYRNGLHYDYGEGVQHFDTAEEAVRYTEGGALEPEQLTDPCFHVFTFCGYALDEDDEGIFHFDTAKAAHDSAVAFNWRFVCDGFACPADFDCDNCEDSIARREQARGPLLPPVPVADGQESLIGGNTGE